MEWIFLDASGIVALLNKSDQLHIQANAVYQRFRASWYRFLTTDIVLMEVGNVLSQPAFKRAVNVYIETLRQSRKSSVIYTNEVDFTAGLQRYGKYADKDWGLSDCVSFEVMRQYSCTQVFTNDHHFTQAGFAILLP